MGSETSKYRIVKNQDDGSPFMIENSHYTAIHLPQVETRIIVESTSRRQTYTAIVSVIICLLLLGIVAYFFSPSDEKPINFTNQSHTTNTFGGTTHFDLTTKTSLNNELELDCGIVDAHSYHHQTFLEKIINGAQSSPHSWPWAVAIKTQHPVLGWDFGCGGSLINSRWILTAAHCLLKSEEVIVLTDTLGLPNSTRFLDPDAIQIVIGIQNLAADTHPENVYKVKRAIHHPNYNKSAKSNDIALIELIERVPRSENVQYLCWHQGVQLSVGETVQAIGWGSTSSFGGGSSNVLNEVPIRILDDENCQSDKYNRTIHICAGEPTGDSNTIHDTCYGDSGGPIMVKRQNKWIAVGVVSFSVHSECDGYGVYTRVRYYQKWIMETITA